MADLYSRLDFSGTGAPPPPPHPDDSDDEHDHPLVPGHPPLATHSSPANLYDPPPMDTRRTPSPGHPLAGYQLDDEPYRPHVQQTAGYPASSAQMPEWPENASNVMIDQPTVSSPLALGLRVRGALDGFMLTAMQV